MRCSACGADCLDGKRFCADCGAPLAASCASCGAELVHGKKFCGDCGAPVVDVVAAGSEPPAPPAAVSERRVVSVLFADLVGFTPLSESRDAEAVRELLSGYFDVARTVVARYGGTVEKFIGDAVMAVWGVPAAKEDDAERCVRAALELVDAVADYGRTNGADGLAARAGVVTGEVAVTIGATGEGMVAGDAVNTASRVQAEAEPGTVLVDDNCRQATAAGIGYVDTGPHLLKGKADAMRLWRATRLIAAMRGSERVDGLEAGFLGRDREFRQVKDVFHGVLDDGRARMASVIGAAGVGKSRLRWEFFKYSDGLVIDLLYHAGRCLPYGDGVAYWALAEMVRQRLDIAEDESADYVMSKLEDGLRRWVDDEADREFLRPRLGALLRVADPGLAREELFAGWRLWFERLAEQQPVVLVVEDLQWADAGLLDFLEQLLDWSSEQPIFLLTLSRPELLQERPTWVSGRRNAATVVLDELSDPLMAELLDELVPGLPAEVRERIVAQADGIPLYAVELVRSMIDHDVVQPIDGVYRLVGTVDTIAVPASLSSLVASRIDALPADERALVQGLAVLGGTFARQAVGAVTDLPVEQIDTMLADLVRREILRVRTDRLSPDRGQYGFTQTLLRQVAYDTLSRRDRKDRHLAVAAHLRETYANDGADVAEVIAHHYLDAYEAVPDDADAEQVRTEAANAFIRAAQQALSIGAPETGERAFVTAADLTADEAKRTSLIEQAGEAAIHAARYESALARFEAAAAHYVAVDDDHEAGRVATRIGYALFRLGRLEEATRRLQDAVEVLECRPPDAALAEAHVTLAATMLFGGQRTDAASHVDAALQLGEALLLPDILAMAASRRGILLSYMNRPQEALNSFEWAISLAEKHDLPYQAVLAHNNAADMGLNGDLPGAAAHAQTGVEHARRRGERRLEAIGLTNLVAVYVLQGRWDDAERLCSEALSGPDHPDHIWLYHRQAVLHALRGQLDAARQDLAGLAPWAGSQDLQSRNTRAMIDVLVALAEGDHTNALALGEPAVHEVADAMGFHNDMFRELWPDTMEAALLQGRYDKAGELLDVVASRPPGHVPPYLNAQAARFRARLAAARGEHDRVGFDLTEAEETFRGLGYPYWTARAQLDHADWLLERGHPEAAAPLLAAAAEVFDRLGAQPAIAQTRELVTKLPEHLVEAGEPGLPEQRALTPAAPIVRE